MEKNFYKIDTSRAGIHILGQMTYSGLTRSCGLWIPGSEYEDTEDLLDIRGVHHIELPTLDSFSEEKQETFLKEYRKYFIKKYNEI